MNDLEVVPENAGTIENMTRTAKSTGVRPEPECDVSVIIPTYNMSDYLAELWLSLRESQILRSVKEVVVVNDGSNDQTLYYLGLIQQEPDGNKLKIVDLPTNQGRFIARQKGAEFATGSLLLFLDTRVQANKDFGIHLRELTQKHKAIMGGVDLDEKQSVYTLYWKRTHEFMFKKYFRDIEAGFFLNAENYDQYVKGTTVFLCPKQVFLDACRAFNGRVLHSDDTFLMREIVKTQPIWVDRRLSVVFEPRQQLLPFLSRLWERGPKFAEYHIFERRGLYFWLFSIWCASYLSVICALVIVPRIGATLLASGILVLLLSAALFSKSLSEFLKLGPLHVLTIHSYAFGAVWGVLVNFGLVAKPKPTAAIKNDPRELL